MANLMRSGQKLGITAALTCALLFSGGETGARVIFTKVADAGVSPVSTSSAGDGSDPKALFAQIDGAEVRVADADTTMPSRSGTFARFAAPASQAGAAVAFLGYDSSGYGGVYLWRASNGSLTRIADHSTPIPDGKGVFEEFLSTRVREDGTVMFEATGPGNQKGLYFGNGRETHRILDLSTPIDEKPLADVSIAGDSWSEDTITLQAIFTDGSCEVFSASGIAPYVGVSNWIAY